MAEPILRLVAAPAALAQAPADWTREMLADAEIALLPGGGDLAEIHALAHRLGLVSVAVLRGEDTAAAQTRTVIDHAGGLPLVWIDAAFTAEAERWARDRGPMTLLVPADGPLGDADRGRIARFAATLGRQSE